MNDPYQVLGIQRGASDDEIKKAYRAQCKRWHPDLNPGDPTAEEHFKQVQEAYDLIVKGDADQNAYRSAAGYAQRGGSGYRYGSPDYGAQDGDGYSGTGGFYWADDPFGFGDIFGQAYGFGQNGARYTAADPAELQAARNFLVNGRYAEARRVLDAFTARSARWYYLSALANQGLGRSIDALADARRACEMEPGSMEYQSLYRRLQTPGGTYRTQSAAYGGGTGFGRWCLSLVLLNLFCQLFSGGCFRNVGYFWGSCV